MSIRTIIIGALLVISAAGCNKVLNVEPEYDLDASKRFKSIDDYQFSLYGTYAFFQSTSYYGATDAAANAFVTLPDMLADDLRENLGESLGNERVFSNWTYSAEEVQIEGVWQAGYRIINQANLTLTGIDRFAGTDELRVNQIKGQALAIRAMVHFDLLRYWADDYDRNSTAPGIPYITKYEYEQKPSRATVKQNYDSIENDLLEAKELLTPSTDPDDPTVNAPGERAYIDQDVVNAILARVYLYANEMDKAAEFATYVIDNYPLASRQDFPAIWTDASLEEVVWSYTFDAGQGTPGGNVYAPNTGRAQYIPSAELIDALNENNDIRYDAYFELLAGGPPAYEDREVMDKYSNKLASRNNPDGVTNFKAFRTGEMYLIRAEALARSGTPDFDAAMDDLNTLRDARIEGYVPETLTGDALLEAIEMERRKELFAEGHRFFDLKRKGRTERQVVRNGCTTNFCTLDPNRREWTWPIPQAEIDANKNILPQNGGY